jgi:uncharacterized protein (DUF2384 family)
MTRSEARFAALAVFEDAAATERWLKGPCRALGGEIPAEVAKTQAGAQRVLEVPHRIEHGIYQ